MISGMLMLISVGKKLTFAVVLKYKDQIKARWGVDLKESLLDMPEFIGGISCDVDVNHSILYCSK